MVEPNPGHRRIVFPYGPVKETHRCHAEAAGPHLPLRRHRVRDQPRRTGRLGRPRRWRRLLSLGTLGGPQSEAEDINDRGEIVGWSDTVPRSVQWNSLHAFLWRDGRMRNPGTLGSGWGSAADAINERSQVVGWSHVYDEATSPHAFVWQDGRMLNLGTLAAARDSRRRDQRARLGTREERGARFRALVRVGQGEDRQAWLPRRRRAGCAQRPRAGRRCVHRRDGPRPVLWQNGRMTFLPTRVGISRGNAQAINARGHIIGWIGGGTARGRGVVWMPRGSA